MSPQLPTPVANLMEAVSSGDTDAFLQTFSVSGVVDDWNRTVTGAADIRRWSDTEFIGKRARLSIYSIDVFDDQVLVVADLRSTGFNGPSTFTFTVANGAVSAMKIRA